MRKEKQKFIHLPEVKCTSECGLGRLLGHSSIYLLYSAMFSSHYLLSKVFLIVQALFIFMDAMFDLKLVPSPQKSRYEKP